MKKIKRNRIIIIDFSRTNKHNYTKKEICAFKFLFSREVLMSFYLIQHAKSKPKDVDPERGLTEEGIGEIERSASFFARSNFRVDEIWHSSKKRARQSAHIIKSKLGNVAIKEMEGLLPKDDIGIIAQKLDKEKNIMIVGHLPSLSLLSSFLLTDERELDIIDFKNAGIDRKSVV